MWLFTFFSYVTTNHHRYHLAPLLRRAHVQQLLKEVVAEGVHHQLRELVAHLVVDHVHHLLGMLVQTLLQRAAARCGRATSPGCARGNSRCLRSATRSSSATPCA